jgi:hypothetical protein
MIREQPELVGFGDLMVGLIRTWLVTAVCVSAVAGCYSSTPDPGSETDVALRSLIQAHGLTGDPAEGHDLPSIEDPVAVLGRKLFFSKSLGGGPSRGVGPQALLQQEPRW